jgi:hypothetical protein
MPVDVAPCVERRPPRAAQRVRLLSVGPTDQRWIGPRLIERISRGQTSWR